MATSLASTPLKSHAGLFSSRTAGGRLPLTPSPRPQSSTVAPVNLQSSPFTPERTSQLDAHRPSQKSIYGGNLTAHLARSSAKSRNAQQNSPKSNIARSTATPKKALELGVSDFTLTGTGKHNQSKSPAGTMSMAAPTKSTKSTSSKPTTTKPAQPKQRAKAVPTHAADRFIPNRGASSAIVNVGSGRPDGPSKKKKVHISQDSSAILSAAADDAIAALESLNFDQEADTSSEDVSRPSPNTVAYQDSLANACGVSMNTRILEFKPAAPESSKPVDLRKQYNRPIKPANASSAQFRRRIATGPERVLDAPGLIDDYYLNLLDWSSGDQIAIGLERNVYIWSAAEGAVSCLLESSPDTYISSVKWSGDGAYVGVGLGSGEIQIWDVAEGAKIRSMFGHDTRVGVMGWDKHLLSSGARSGLVFNHDVRIAEHKVAELVSHTSEVCGLEWRSDGQQLATGGNDNLVSIWDSRSLSVPKFTKTNHKAAVKALSWCPWNSNLLATGGGSYDRHIHFWNTTSGARVNSIDTGSQVTSLRWSPHHREIVSSSGFPDNSLTIWSYPNLVRNIDIPAHESRVLHSCLSPDGQTLATAAADESLKFWKLFEKKPGATGFAGAGSSSKAAMVKQMTIR
jgi:cell division cycle 20, cofactor of APC complex